MKRKTTEENFRFIYQYMKRLGELTHKAWNVPNRLTDKDISDLRRLCSLTKCEASTWYQLERYQLEASSRKSRENPDYDEIAVGQCTEQRLRPGIQQVSDFQGTGRTGEQVKRFPSSGNCPLNAQTYSVLKGIFS